AKLEKGLVIMATISGGAPMLGFLGTVLGMVQTFYNMSQNASGVIEMSALSTGMYQAMVTTIGGLIVGILAMFAYNFLVARIDSVVRQLEGRTMEFMDLLNEPA
ncbi:MAG: MotA/TolQ/ExbB proton channel family protein, partial [Paludibacteraceae bacterium]|nr:MotA/TolQ/ExbB proton channel family protein [Paludibacteraceae bacterium]